MTARPRVAPTRRVGVKVRRDAEGPQTGRTSAASQI